jgi:hypothetical protein
MWEIMYQLGTHGATHHIGYVYYDNGQRNRDGLVIVVTIRRIEGTEYDTLVRDIVGRHGVEAVARRNGRRGKPVLEYHKFCIIWHGLERPVVVDMDTLQRLAGPSEASLHRLARGPCDVGPEAELTMVYDTEAHGKVTVHLATVADPDIRSRIAVDTERPVTKDTAYGALVKAVNPRQLRVRKIMRMPPLPPQGIAAVNDSTFFVPKAGTLKGRDVTMMVPRGGRQGKFGASVSDH